MEPSRNPKWTKEDAQLFAQLLALLAGAGLILGGLSGEGAIQWALAGAALWGLITVSALVIFWAMRR